MNHMILTITLEIAISDVNATDCTKTAKDFIEFSRDHLNHLGAISKREPTKDVTVPEVPS